jgi:multiple sugar transport system permease protein
MKRPRRELTNGQFALLLSFPVIAFLVMIMIYPMIYAIWLSFQEVSFFGGFKTAYVGFANYEDALLSRDFWWSTLVTIRFAVLSVVLSIGIGLGLAMLMHRAGRLRAILGTIIILPWSVSLYGAGVMWAYLSRGQTGVASSLINLILGTDSPDKATEYSLISGRHIVDLLALGNAWNIAPLVAFFLLANLQTIPSRLHDLAALDQLTAWERFVHVTLPPLHYSLFVFTSIALILSMKQLDFIYVMSAGGPGDASSTLTFRLYELAFRESEYGLSAAMSFYLLFLTIGSALMLHFLWGRRLEGA